MAVRKNETFEPVTLGPIGVPIQNRRLHEHPRCELAFPVRCRLSRCSPWPFVMIGWEQVSSGALVSMQGRQSISVGRLQ
jgi:hypothetical protein